MASSCNKNRMRMIFGGFDNYDADDYDGDDDHDYGECNVDLYLGKFKNGFLQNYIIFPGCIPAMTNIKTKT